MVLKIQSQTLELVSQALAKLFEDQGFENISITNDIDYLELSLDRDSKFPALILKGPEIEINSFVKSQGLYGKIIEKNTEDCTYAANHPPAIVDVVYTFYIIGEEQVEVLNSIINIIAIFNDEARIVAEDIEYRVYLIDTPDFEEDTEDETHTIYAVGSVGIEGVEIYDPNKTAETGHLMYDLEQNTSKK